jgi:hypothetical protein
LIKEQHRNATTFLPNKHVHALNPKMTIAAFDLPNRGYSVGLPDKFWYTFQQGEWIFCNDKEIHGDTRRGTSEQCQRGAFDEQRQ